MKSMTRIKICGLTRSQDVDAAVAAGADAIGLVFYPASPRCIDLAQAVELTRRVPPFVDIVGLFVNAAPTQVRAGWPPFRFICCNFTVMKTTPIAASSVVHSLRRCVFVRISTCRARWQHSLPHRRSCSMPSSKVMVVAAKPLIGRWFRMNCLSQSFFLVGLMQTMSAMPFDACIRPPWMSLRAWNRVRASKMRKKCAPL